MLFIRQLMDLSIPWGVYFRCKATGSLLEKGDETDMIGWVSLEKLRSLVEQDEFCGVDKAGVEFYLTDYNRKNAQSLSKVE